MTQLETPPKAVLITGAARRIGRALALDFAGKGWKVAIHHLNSSDQAKQLAGELDARGGHACVVRADLRDGDSPHRLIAEATRALGPITCLINNASVFEPDEIQSLTMASWSSHIDVNLRAPLFLTQAFSQQLPDTLPGNIINILDQKILSPTPEFLSYTASKSGLLTLTQTLAQALSPSIRVNAIGPGPTLANARQTKDDFDRQVAATLLKRPTGVEEICSAVQFILASPSLTGQMIALDAGEHLARSMARDNGFRE